MLRSFICTHRLHKHGVSVQNTSSLYITDRHTLACIPSAYMDMSACAHQKAQKYSSYVHARQQRMHTSCYQNAKQQRIICCNRVILAEQQLIHFVRVHSLLFPEKQRTPRFPDQSHITCHSRQNLQMLLNIQNLLPASISYTVTYTTP